MKHLSQWLLIFCLLLVACDGATSPTPGANNGTTAVAPTTASTNNGTTLADVLPQQTDLSSFVAAITQAGLMPALSTSEPFTLFIPSNSAMESLGLVATQLPPEDLQALVRVHLIPRLLQAADFTSGVTLSTLQGDKFQLSSSNNQNKIGYALITNTIPIPASNGNIYVLNTVLVPAENSAIKSIWGTLTSDGRFTNLTNLIAGTPIMYTLRYSNFPDAYLAPTDTAFQQLAPQWLTRVQTDPEQAQQLLNYHILVPENWPPRKNLALTDISSMTEIKTAVHSANQFSEYQTVQISHDSDNNLLINNAHIVESNIQAKNGMVHIIDQVLIPPSWLTTP